MTQELKLTIYNEFVHEQKNDFVKRLYPKGMHGAIADYMRNEPGVQVTTATLEMEEHGLTEEVSNSTDVLMWWPGGRENTRECWCTTWPSASTPWKRSNSSAGKRSKTEPSASSGMSPKPLPPAPVGARKWR